MGKNNIDIENKINNTLRNLNLYFNVNKLKMNATKTKYMIFKNNISLNININNTTISQCHVFKLLGFPIESTLKLSSIINYIITKLNVCSIILQRSRYFLNKKLLSLIFNSIGLTYITYFSIISKTCTNYDFSKLERKYNQCGSIIFNCVYDSLELYKWPKLAKVLYIYQCAFIFNILKKHYSPALNEIINTQTVRPYNLRNNSQLSTVRCNSNIGQASFNYWGRKLWNTIPNHIKDSDTLMQFKSKLILFLSSDGDEVPLYN